MCCFSFHVFFFFIMGFCLLRTRQKFVSRILIRNICVYIFFHSDSEWEKKMKTIPKHTSIGVSKMHERNAFRPFVISILYEKKKKQFELFVCGRWWDGTSHSFRGADFIHFHYYINYFFFSQLDNFYCPLDRGLSHSAKKTKKKKKLKKKKKIVASVLFCVKIESSGIYFDCIRLIFFFLFMWTTNLTRRWIRL